MVKITKIEIKNFRAFYGTYQIDLHRAGKSLLIYGENGSGKVQSMFAPLLKQQSSSIVRKKILLLSTAKIRET